MNATCAQSARARCVTIEAQLSPGALAELDQPQVLLQEPEPHTKLGQQVRRLEQHGLYKMADAVKACGRLGEKWTYACGRAFLRKIIRSHRRFCCWRCDQHIAERAFEEHRAYRERLHPSGTLHRVTVRSSNYAISSDGVRGFETTLMESVRSSFGETEDWGLKFWTDYEAGCLVARGIIYLPPGVSLPTKGLQVPSATCSIGKAVSVTAFEDMLSSILRPSLKEDRGILRADVMAAFRGGKHLRSLRVFYGLISKKRMERNPKKLPLSTDSQSGTTSVERQHVPARSSPPCPHCGPGCQRVSISTEPISELRDIPNLSGEPLDRELLESS